MQVHILDDWFDTLRKLSCFAQLARHEVKVWTDQAQDEEALAERLRDAEALVLFRERTQITRSLLEKLPKLKLISGRGAYPHVDLSACTERGILFCSKTGGAGQDNTNYAAAELTFALILSALRDLPQQMQSVKAGQWQAGVGKSLRGRTLGIYGYGRIGKAVAHYAQAFAMRPVFWASPEGLVRAQDAGAEVAPNRETFFATSDIVSLHLRLTPETQNLITARDLAEMRPDSLLVNTSRAGLIARGALLSALQAGRPGKAALDVFDEEPLTDASDPLLSHPNVIATPHIGFVTEDEFDKQFADSFAQVNAYAEGAPINLINPEVWTRSLAPDAK